VETGTDAAAEDATVVEAGSASAPERVESFARPSDGRYLVIEEIGRGGMGRVFRAYDPKLQREVALKVVRSEVAPGEPTRG
jgi:hypothetical protein